MQIDREVIRAALEKKGFKHKPSNHDFYYLHDETGRKTAVFTKLSHGTGYKSYGDDLISEVYHRLRLVKKEFLKLIDCELEYKSYLELLKQRGEIR